MIENTAANTDPEQAARTLFLARMGFNDGVIESMEADGQRQLLESCDLPTKGSDDPEFIRLGFTFGEPHPNDPLFRPATLPEGWRREGTDHSMHTKILDEFGRERVSVFYKAAFYDRRADMHLNTVYGYVTSLLYYGGEPVLDEEWATAEAVADAARGEIARQNESLELWTRPDVVTRQGAAYCAERVAECREEIRKAEALIAKIGG